MEFASGATAIRFAAFTRTFRQRAAKEPLTGGQLRNPRTEVALGGGEFGSVQGVAQ
jgi:hypothetical protein